MNHRILTTVLWRGLRPALALAALALILFGIKLFLIGTYGNSTPYWDQWDSEAMLLYAPFLEGRLGCDQLLATHNEHRIMIPKLLAIGLLSANGIWNPLLQMVVNAAFHVGLVCLLIALLAGAMNRKHLLAILAFCLLLFSWPYGWENTLAGFQSCFYFSLLFSVGSIWLLIWAAPFSARWWAGTGLAIGAFFCLASGVFVLAAVAAVVVIQRLLGMRNRRCELVSAMVLGGLFVLGVVLTPSIPGHAPLKATTLIQFLNSWSAVLGWPIKLAVFGPLLRNAPAVLFVATMLRRRPPANDRRWFLFALVVWMISQGVSIAYGRATCPISSRYTDVFAIDVLINFTCLLVVVGEFADTRRWAVLAVVGWTAVVLGGIGFTVHNHCVRDLKYRFDTAQAQEINTRNYVLTGDIKHLTDKPYLHVPYPQPDRLASILDNPLVRSILPRNIGVPLQGSLIGSVPANACTVGGYAPGAPIPQSQTWGTFGSNGAAAIGKAAIVFPASHRGYYIQIPVIGGPHEKGVTLELQQNDKRWLLYTSRDSNQMWDVATAKVRGGPFTLHITDGSPGAWLAVGSPVAVGMWDESVERLLARWDVFVIIGSVLAVTLLIFYSLRPDKTPGELIQHIQDDGHK